MLSFGEYRKCSIRMKNRTIFTKICEWIPFSGLQYQNNISYCSDVKCHKYEVPKFSWIKEGKKLTNTSCHFHDLELWCRKFILVLFNSLKITL